MKKLMGWVLVLVVGLMQTGCEEHSLILIETNKGDIKVKLYDETPQHRDNFMKLVHEETLNGTLFHRVIKEFMIQGGDPDSKGAEPGKMLGSGGLGYTIEAEIKRDLIHKKGALSAARQGDQVNPERRSSACQFYIVQGKTWTAEELEPFERQRKSLATQEETKNFFQDSLNKAYADRLEALQESRDQMGIRNLIMEVKPTIDSIVEAKGPYTYSEEEREIYATLGGAPHLDGAYTVFGEVVEGLDVVDSIAAMPTNNANRPLEDVVMNMRFVKK